MIAITIAIIVLLAVLILILRDAAVGDENWDEEEMRNIAEARRYMRELDDKEQLEYLEEYRKQKEEKNARKLHRKLQRRERYCGHSDPDEKQD